MGFIGFAEDYEKYKETDVAKAEATEQVEDGNTIAFDNTDPISDEDLLTLTQTRNRHDAHLVYMQSDSDFYDVFYNKDLTQEDPLLMEARGIRRLYKRVVDYMWACSVRDEYMSKLVDKYGGPELFSIFYNAGAVNDWIPPIPLFSKNSPEYDAFMNGEVPTVIGGPDDGYNDEKILEITQMLFDELGRAPEDFNIVCDVETRYDVLNRSGLQNDSSAIRYSSGNTKIAGVSVNDLSELQREFSSWYRDDLDQEDKKEHKKFFSQTPAAIREEYYSQVAVPEARGQFQKMLETGTMDEDEENLNEMVIDSVTNIPMTREELKKRKFIRRCKEAGWDEVRMMRAFHVGTSAQLRLMEQKQRNKKKSKKKAKNFIDSITGDDIMAVGSVDDLSSLLYDD